MSSEIEYKAVVEHVLTPQEVADIVVTAFEGGISYWCGSAQQVGGAPTTVRPWYSDPDFYTQPFEIVLTDLETDDEYSLTSENLQKAFREISSDLLKAIISGDYDAWDADTIIQLAVFGQVVFG